MNVIQLPDFLSKKECDVYRKMIDREIQHEKLWLRKDSGSVVVTNFLQDALDRSNKLYKVVGTEVTFGKYAVGERLCRHSDNPYQGDSTHVLLVYLNSTVGHGGNTVFYDSILSDTPDISIVPEEGKGIIFGIWDVHEALPVSHGYKYIIGCELIKIEK